MEAVLARRKDARSLLMTRLPSFQAEDGRRMVSCELPAASLPIIKGLFRQWRMTASGPRDAQIGDAELDLEGSPGRAMAVVPVASRAVVVAALTGKAVRFRSSASVTAKWTPQRPEAITAELGWTLAPALFEFLQHRDAGVLELCRQTSSARVIAACMVAFPTKRIFVACSSKQEAIELRAKIAGLLPRHLRDRVRRCDGSADPPRGPQSFVGLYSDSANLLQSVEVEAADVEPYDGSPDLLFCNARTAIQESNRFVINHHPRAKLFGYVRDTDQLSPWQQDEVDVLFGFEAFRVPPPGLQDRPVEVELLLVPPQPNLRGDLGGNPLWEQGIRRDRRRNQAVVRAAKSFAGEGLRTLLVAADLKHATRLSSSLRGWSVALSDQDQHPGCIVTPHHLRDLVGGHYDVVINASAADIGEDLRALFQFPVIKLAEPALVVDFSDQHHWSLRKRAAERRSSYERLGWTGCPSATRLLAYLKRRITRS